MSNKESWTVQDKLACQGTKEVSVLKKKSSVLQKQTSTVLTRYEQWLKHAFQNQLFLYAYLHGKCVMPLACERVITCRVRTFTLFPETPYLIA